MSQIPNAETLASEQRVTLFRKRDPAPDRWAAGYGPIKHSVETQASIFGVAEMEIGELLALIPFDRGGAPLFDLRRQTCIVGGSDDPWRHQFKS